MTSNDDWFSIIRRNPSVASPRQRLAPKIREPLMHRRTVLRSFHSKYSRVDGRHAGLRRRRRRGGAELSRGGRAPGCRRRTLPASRMGIPKPVALHRQRADGPRNVHRPPLVYLVRSGVHATRALDSTCTHLGCRTRFNADSKADRVPVPRRDVRRHRHGHRRAAAVASQTLPTRVQDDPSSCEV